MYKVINRFLLPGEKLIPEMHLRQLGFTVLVEHLLKTKKEYQNLKKQEIHDIFIKTK